MITGDHNYNLLLEGEASILGSNMVMVIGKWCGLGKGSMKKAGGEIY